MITMKAPQMSAALQRALFGAALAAIAAAITWLASKPEYAVYAGIAGAAFSRFLLEGGYDSKRADEGDIKSSDVGVHN